MGIELTLVTSEEAPLGLFGARASEAIGELLETRGIASQLPATPAGFEDGILRLAPEGEIEVAAVVALPRLEGPRLPGLPCDRNGFVPSAVATIRAREVASGPRPAGVSAFSLRQPRSCRLVATTHPHACVQALSSRVRLSLDSVDRLSDTDSFGLLVITGLTAEAAPVSGAREEA
jgi:hypothetical protein